MMAPEIPTRRLFEEKIEPQVRRRARATVFITGLGGAAYERTPMMARLMEGAFGSEPGRLNVLLRPEQTGFRVAYTHAFWSDNVAVDYRRDVLAVLEHAGVIVVAE